MRLRQVALTEHEPEIKIAWQNPAGIVGDVCEETLRRRKLAYTTVTTMAGILEEKGFLNTLTDIEERLSVKLPGLLGPS